MGCVYHLSQVRNTFQYPLSKPRKNKRKAFLIFPKLETRFNTHYQNPRKNKRKAFLIFPKLETRFNTHYQNRVNTKERRFYKPPNQNSFAFIICKNHTESCLETLILRQKCDNNRTFYLSDSKQKS